MTANLKMVSVLPYKKLVELQHGSKTATALRPDSLGYD
jgi:hypothetical protein